MATRKFGALSSSSDPNKLSLTVGSITALLISVISLYFSAKGVAVPADLTDQVENIARMAMAAVSGIGIVVSAVTGAIGALRKLASTLSSK